jgi:hypothetical protein
MGGNYYDHSTLYTVPFHVSILHTEEVYPEGHRFKNTIMEYGT